LAQIFGRFARPHGLLRFKISYERQKRWGKPRFACFDSRFCYLMQDQHMIFTSNTMLGGLSLAFQFMASIAADHGSAAGAAVPAYSSNEVEWSRHTGSNSIEARAVIADAQLTKICTAEVAFLRPRSAFEDHRTLTIFGTLDRARIPVLQYLDLAGEPGISRPPKAYDADARKAKCTGEGKFSFPGVPDGEYYVTIMVLPTGYVGKVTPIETIEVLMRHVAVADGETMRVDLSSEQ
jgi:hypothetical protein